MLCVCQAQQAVCIQHHNATAMHEYATFVRTFSHRLRKAGLTLSTAAPSGNLVSEASNVPFLHNETGYSSLGQSGAEILTMNTYYREHLTQHIAGWKDVVNASVLTVGFDVSYFMHDHTCRPNQTAGGGCLASALGLASQLAVESVALFMLDVFGGAKNIQEVPSPSPWPPQSWWALLHEWRNGDGDPSAKLNGGTLH
jgi:hypothetical protein